jgi:hypothetical protein
MIMIMTMGQVEFSGKALSAMNFTNITFFRP